MSSSNLNNMRISNDDFESLLICLEPIGSTFELPANDYLEIITNEVSVPLEIKYSTFNTKKVIAIWPNLGTVRILYKGEVLDI